MQINLVWAIFVASGSVLASVLGGLRERTNDNCPDGSRRNPASAASQAGPLPYCANYVSTSVCIVTSVATVTAPHVVTKTVCTETDVTTTVQKTNTVTQPTVRVTTVLPVVVTVTTTSVTCVALLPFM
ncbi:hypothetical protein Q9L58_002673 [Maublancomyces gigas]|uniref:Uncharacterized protein n=1 Tax=Discina gigas TaxID=1032678 RepID=A0ABR3GRK6_9PEZI